MADQRALIRLFIYPPRLGEKSCYIRKLRIIELTPDHFGTTIGFAHFDWFKRDFFLIMFFENILITKFKLIAI